MRYIGLARPQDGYKPIWDCSYYWRTPLAGVNEKPFLGSKDERVCTKLDNLYTKYNIN